MTATPSISDSLELPISKRCISNRLLKAALTETLADPNTCQPNERHFTLYETWSQGGCSMILTGNVMVDREHRESPRNVVLDGDSDLADFQHWANAIHSHSDGYNSKPLAIMQISHPGRQCPLACTRREITPVSSSSAQQARLVLPGILGAICGKCLIRPARALGRQELPSIVQKYATTANLAEKAGWDGVQIHAAHGYLLSQFLSPSANHRTDEYGGKKGRKKLLLEVIAAVREATSPSFVVGIKINTKDRAAEGSERETECLHLIQDLCDLQQLDFIELSGGNYEDAIFITATDDAAATTTGIFGSFAERLQAQLQVTEATPKFVLTGGFRTKAGMQQALQQNLCNMIGLGRPVITNPRFSKDILDGNYVDDDDDPVSSTLRAPVFQEILNAALNSLWYQRQLHRLSIGLSPNPKLSYIYTLVVSFWVAYIWDFKFQGHAAYKQNKKANGSTENKQEN
ncbi:NADH-dependent flavin oxidoreductase nadA [Seminavis robusta]|uniref:NADH-dependent flavin oxidoreductase nadA n=1 Tax=Seminavis robusta TaxID=568900 RepID=A0A9N8HJT0_9STRA|nr:NADH-dependent flavin oxidoreductase nadA [Seminavis robusta]|eukprot:Sro883_g215460.1 NADH-dependent flavin oxidoreductase nadA (460) ;mRNA; f:16396-17775